MVQWFVGNEQPSTACNIYTIWKFLFRFWAFRWREKCGRMGWVVGKTFKKIRDIYLICTSVLITWSLTSANQYPVTN